MAIGHGCYHDALNGNSVDRLSENTYDEVAYPTFPRFQTHPAHLQTMAFLGGLESAPPGRCRVLELGCGDGGNLLSMAVALPESRFVGVDLAGTAIERGNSAVTALGLANIRLMQADLLNIDASIGEFDYIIAHGLYAWVPDPVREKLLAICASQLALDGIAFISFNSFPGCHLRLALREMLLFHIQHIRNRQQRLAEARSLLKTLSGALVADPRGEAIRKEVERLIDLEDGYLFHDDLAEVYRPVYFHEFAAHAQRHGLRYLCDARYWHMEESPLTDVAGALSETAGEDRDLRAQYVDFFKVRPFREALLCKGDRTPDFRALSGRFQNLFVASSSAPVGEPDAEGGLRFQIAEGRSLSTNHPIAKAALAYLGQVWPRWVRFPDLLDEILAPDVDEDARQSSGEALSEMLLRLSAVRFVQALTTPPQLASQLSERPVASPLVRYQLSTGSAKVSSLRHTTVELSDPLSRHTVRLLDGTHNRTELLDELVALVKLGVAKLEINKEQITDPARVPDLLARSLEGNLEKLMRLGLLSA